MNEIILETLKGYVDKYSEDEVFNEKLCYSYLKDFCGEYKKELFMISSALKENIPQKLKSISKSKDTYLVKVEIEKLAKSLTENLGFSKEHSLWTVHTWAKALSIDLVDIEEDTLNKTVIEEVTYRQDDSKLVPRENQSKAKINEQKKDRTIRPLIDDYNRKDRIKFFKLAYAIFLLIIIIAINILHSSEDSTIEPNSISYGYILPTSNMQYISDEDILRLLEEGGVDLIELAVNEIYARHGLVFQDEYYNGYFNSKNWYNPDQNIQQKDQLLDFFSEVEKINISTLMSSIEANKNEDDWFEIPDSWGDVTQENTNDINDPVFDSYHDLDNEEIYIDDDKADKEIFYRVIAGSFREQSNAESLEKSLNESGFNTFILEPYIQGSVTGAEHLYSVLNESYHSLNHAQIQAEKLREAGFEAVISIYER